MKPLSSSAFKWTWTVEGEESPKLWHTSHRSGRSFLLANARFDAVENHLYHSVAFRVIAHTFTKAYICLKNLLT